MSSEQSQRGGGGGGRRGKGDRGGRQGGGRGGRTGGSYGFQHERLNDKKEQAELKAIRDEIDAKIKKVSECTKRMQEISKLNKEEFAKRKDARDYLQKNVNQPKNALKEEIKELKRKLEINAEALNQARNELRSLKDTLPANKKKDETEDEFLARCYRLFDEKINETTQEIESSVVSLAQEKKLVNQLEREKGKKTLLDGYQQKVANVKVYKQIEEDLRSQMQAKRDSFTQLSSGENERAKVLKDTKKIVDDNDARIQEILKERNGIKTEIAELKAKEKEKRDEINKMWAEWKAEQEVKRTAWREEQNKLKAARKEEMKVEAEKRRREEALKPPYEKELATCDQLISYLDNLPAPKKKSGTLKHSLDVFRMFEGLSLMIPQTSGQLDQAKQELQTKKQEYLDLQKEVLEKKRIELEEEEKRLAEEEKKKAEQEENAEQTIESSETKDIAEEEKAKEENEDSSPEAQKDTEPQVETEEKTEDQSAAEVEPETEAVAEEKEEEESPESA